MAFFVRYHDAILHTKDGVFQALAQFVLIPDCPPTHKAPYYTALVINELASAARDRAISLILEL